MIIKTHNSEANLLARRLEFLNILNNLLYEGINLSDIQDNPEFELLESQFDEVATPSDLIGSIDAIYHLSQESN